MGTTTEAPTPRTAEPRPTGGLLRDRGIAIIAAVPVTVVVLALLSLLPPILLALTGEAPGVQGASMAAGLALMGLHIAPPVALIAALPRAATSRRNA
jgi:hypothetical protein